jgi:hypothetical protein
MFAWPYFKPRTMIGVAGNFRFFFRTGDWPTPEEQREIGTAPPLADADEADAANSDDTLEPNSEPS